MFWFRTQLSRNWNRHSIFAIHCDANFCLLVNCTVSVKWFQTANSNVYVYCIGSALVLLDFIPFIQPLMLLVARCGQYFVALHFLPTKKKHSWRWGQGMTFTIEGCISACSLCRNTKQPSSSKTPSHTLSFDDSVGLVKHSHFFRVKSLVLYRVLRWMEEFKWALKGLCFKRRQHWYYACWISGCFSPGTWDWYLDCSLLK